MAFPDSSTVGISYPDAIRHIDALMERIDAGNDAKGRNKFTGPWVIRGIAGSGKTVRLCQIAAAAHSNHPEWNIAVVFQTRSLYDMIEALMERLCIANGLRWNKDDPRLRVMHAWGSQEKSGFYREVALANGIKPLSAKMAEGEVGAGNARDKFMFACKRLLEQVEESSKGQMRQLFDLVLVDESQDLLTSDPRFKFKDREPFFWMAYSSMRPADAVDSRKRRLVWAFDEYQNLMARRVPKARELFGEDEGFVNLLRGRGEIAPICYRTPHEVTLAAHAICMGLYRREGMVVGPHCRESWESLGYEVEGDFIQGRRIRIRRPLSNSANRPQNYWNRSTIYQDFTHPDREVEARSISKDVSRLIRKERVKPEQVMIICLDEMGRGILESAMESEGVPIHMARYGGLTTDGAEIRTDAFTVENAVTITNVSSAKGNEARVVYVLNADVVADSPEDALVNRNSLYIAMTRTKGWLHLSGLASPRRDVFYSEVGQCLSDIETKELVEFTYRQPRWDPSSELADEVMWKQTRIGDF